MAREVS
jgi:hypothetical protein